MADPVRDFKGDAGGEWVIENGDFAAVSGADAVVQGIRVRLGLFRGECYLNRAAGVQYLDDDETGAIGIIGKNRDPLVVKGELSEAIADTPDVTNVVGAQLVQGDDREASIAYAVDSVYSTEPVSGTVSTP